MHKNITACSGDYFSCRRKTEKRLPRQHKWDWSPASSTRWAIAGITVIDYLIDKIASTLTNSLSQPTQLQATPQQRPILTFMRPIPRMLELSRIRSQKWQGLIRQPLPLTTLLLLCAGERCGSLHTTW